MSERHQQIVLVRHGETAWSSVHRHTGRSDIPLTPGGEQQAATLQERLRAWEFGLVLCSPLQRARRTCEIAGYLGRARFRDDLMEWDYGDIEGHTLAEWHLLHPGWDIWDNGCPGGETIEHVGHRADRVIAEVMAAGTDTVIFGHGHLLRALTARWLGLAAREALHYVLLTAGVSVIGWDGDDRVLLRWNMTAPGHGDPAG